MIDKIYVGCSRPLWKVTNNSQNLTTLVIDKNTSYTKNSKIPLITNSIFDLLTIKQKLKDYLFADYVTVVPVADYAIPCSLAINKYLNQQVYDYSFLGSKKETIRRASKFGVDCINILHTTDVSSEKFYVKNIDNGNDSQSIALLKGSSIDRGNDEQILSEYEPGILINVDLHFDREGCSQVIDIYRRFNDSRFRTVITKSNYSNRGLSNSLTGQIEKLKSMMAGYHGQLTFDFIYADSVAKLVEISPFYHKPWLKILNADTKGSMYEYTLYQDNQFNLDLDRCDRIVIDKLENISLKNNRQTTMLIRHIQ